VGACIAAMVVLSTGLSMLVFWAGLKLPIMVSLFYLIVVAAMGLELSREVLRAAELSDQLREMSGSLAHELNQPLGAILANTEAAELHLQSATPDMEEVRQILADIRKDDLRAGEIIHGIRAFLQRREVECVPVDVARLVDETVELIRADITARQASVSVHVDADVPLVSGDKVQLQQVLLNVLTNGLDAMASSPETHRRLSLRARRNGPGTVEIAAEDAGIGIPAADLDWVFEPFHTTKSGGLGLGLAICRSIVEAHHGSIAVENNPGGGATVRLVLPVSREGAPS
jgi:C4-dicarboxylate-specific signal transduction histidine kinase